MGKLALCYHTGEGVTEDPVQAVVWLQKAADLGDGRGPSPRFLPFEW